MCTAYSHVRTLGISLHLMYPEAFCTSNLGFTTGDKFSKACFVEVKRGYKGVCMVAVMVFRNNRNQ